MPEATKKTSTKKEETKKTLFETLFTMSDKDSKNAKLPLVEKKVKRQLDSAFDDAESKIIEAEESMGNSMKDFDNFDINAILDATQRIKACRSIQEDIQGLYKEYFGEELEGWNAKKKR